MTEDPNPPQPPNDPAGAESSTPPPPTRATPPPLRSAPPPLRAERHREPRRKGGFLWKFTTVALLILLMFSLSGHVLTFFSVGGSAEGTSQFMEATLIDDQSANKIVQISMLGVIDGQPLDPSGYNIVNYIGDQLELCENDPSVRAVILHVDSPGGEVLASDEIARLVEDFQIRTGKPVVASMGSLAASGGYYISAPCRWIVANELTITGSIGVVMAGYNWRGLMDKAGVVPQVYKSGRFKDMLSPMKRPEQITDEERSLVQGMVDETFARFKEVVMQGRGTANLMNNGAGQQLATDWEDYADGRVISGKEAHRLGLVDELGNLKTAKQRAERLAGISSANLVQYRQPYKLGSLLRLLGESKNESTIKLDLGLDLPKLQAGKLYFLSPSYVH